MTSKKNIAIVAGGFSGEYVVSVESAKTIAKNLNPSLYNAYTVVIKNKDWYCECEGKTYTVDKNDFSVTIDSEKITFHCALITIHGTPGEDGKLQGYFDLMQIPYTTSSLLPCALTFNKYFCNAIVRGWGVPVARSAKFFKHEKVTEADVLAQVNLPVFVKPNKGGSSLGTGFVKDISGLFKAIELCFEHDDEALVEEFIPGTELTCGAYLKRGEVVVLPVTEIVSKTDAHFFDFEAKYTPGAADEITPARIPDEITRKVQELTSFLYKKFELKGIARLDYIYTGKQVVFLEANITPGMAQTSIVPQQAEVMGISLMQLFTDVLEESMRVREE